MTQPMTTQVEVMVPGRLSHGFDYAVLEDMQLVPGDYVRVPFGARELPGVVWGPGSASLEKRLKPVAAHYVHLSPMGSVLREFIAWAAWYNCTEMGAVLKMCLPIAEALEPPNARERKAVMQAGAPEPAVLSEEQQAVAGQLEAALDQGFSVTLLDGLTGSGKTEVYFHAISRILEGEGQVLVLLPEISLSIQWLERFRRRFGFQPHVWHSGLPAGARKHTWRAIVNSEARVVVGARSALFLPYRNLKLIVVDEEHDGSYKQEDGVIYQARDMAVARARFEKIPAVLVSATPSLETYQNVAMGKYKAVHLRARHFGAQLPQVTMIDMRTAPLERGAFLAQPLRQALTLALSAGHQSLLFLNRRGYAPLTLCRACGHRFQCPQCTAWLVMHKGGQGGDLRCHHCGYRTPAPQECPECKAAESLFPCGPGVERIAEEVAAFLPKARVEMLTSDTTESHSQLQVRIEAMQAGQVDILIGTQMIAKGHHFSNLALVGIVDADLGLAGGDLRAAERTFQLLQQISGRAGRETVAGRVMVQSFAPDHPVLQALIAGQRDAFMELELEERRRGRMPPFFRLAALIVEGVREEQVAAHARMLARTAPRAQGIEVLGPAPAPLYRLRGKYRQRLLVRAERSLNIQQWIMEWVGAHKTPSALRVKIDIDPQGFL